MKERDAGDGGSCCSGAVSAVLMAGNQIACVVIYMAREKFNLTKNIQI